MVYCLTASEPGWFFPRKLRNLSEEPGLLI